MIFPLKTIQNEECVALEMSQVHQECDCGFPFLYSYTNLQKKMGVERDMTYVWSQLRTPVLCDTVHHLTP